MKNMMTLSIKTLSIESRLRAADTGGGGVGGLFFGPGGLRPRGGGAARGPGATTHLLFPFGMMFTSSISPLRFSSR